MQKKSFIKKIITYMIILMALLLLTLVVFFVSSYNTLKKEIIQSSDNFLKVYGNEMGNRVNKMDALLKNMMTQRTNLSLLKSGDEAGRIYAALKLRSYMDELEMNDESADMIVIADGKYNIYLDSFSQNLAYAEKSKIKQFVMKFANSREEHSARWEFTEINGTVYLYKIYLYDYRAIGVFLRTKKLLNSIPEGDYGERTFVLTDTGELVRGIFGSDIILGDVGKSINSIQTDKYFRIKHSLIDGQAGLVCFVSKSSVIRQTQLSMVIALFIILSTLIFVLFFVLYTRKELISPMNSMVEGMERIREGEYSHRIEGDYNYSEFSLVKESFNQMMDEIIGLKIQFYEKKIELKETELKCIRLQIKPHFFLNAMTTISALSSQGKSKQIKDYIEALSKNIRYMFKSGFHTVAIREEIKHVQNYFEMQEMKYPNCIFYYIDLPKELQEWRIPQMVIHTIIENEYKYAVSHDSTLSILIKISKVTQGGQNMLLIEIEDDGMGYPSYVLDYMNGVTEKPSDDGGRIGLWSIKRMLELMYDRTDLFRLENIEPHGCLNMIYVPENPVHESDKETIQNYL
ncbi:MAG: histidine kinase [Anaerocolumna sp.]